MMCSGARHKRLNMNPSRRSAIRLRLALLWILGFYLPFACVDGASRHHTVVSVVPSNIGRLKALPIRAAFDLRGGSDSEYEEEEDDEDNGLETTSSSMGTLLNLSKRVVVFAGKLTLKSAKAATRALKAAFQGEEEANEESSALSKIVRRIQRMWIAAFYPESENAEAEVETGTETEVKTSASTRPKTKRDVKQPRPDHHHQKADFGAFLAESYGVEASRDELEMPLPVLGGSIADALKTARSQARLLVVLIPSSKPGKSRKATADQLAIESFLSSEVSTIAEKKSRKNADNGSFLLWGAKAGSPEAVSAIKRLKAQQTGNKGQKRPILLVAYLAQVVDKQGMPKTIPRLLAQHHCSPPPLPEMMAAWLNALRKRHAKQYALMQQELRELKLFKERKEGYKDSVQSDIDRQERERREEEERIAREKEEKERQERIQQRRKELLASLPEEPGKSVANVKTIALRFADGRSSQRRFIADTRLSTVFDWVDASFEMERETVVLTTLNGQKSFSWDDGETTLSEAGLPRMVGLRVTESKDEKAAADAASS